VISGTQGTASLAALNSLGSVAQATINGFQIYGNVIVGAGGGNGIFAAGSDCCVYANTKIFNNTIVNSGSKIFYACNPGSIGCPLSTGNVIENNLLYNSNATILYNGATGNTNDFNAYFSATAAPLTEVHPQIATGDPFVNDAAGNFQLTSDLVVIPGLTLSAPFNIDPTGATRGADGTWQRGAFEFVAATIPNPPTNVTALVQ
jgi:hypothetical protein